MPGGVSCSVPMTRPVRWLVFVLFFASGFAALAYQTAWQRLLALWVGGDVTALTVIVTAFMAGLGAGHLAGGALADRFGMRGNLLFFAGAEGVIAVFGLLSEWIFQRVLAESCTAWGASRTLSAVLIFLAMMPATFCMGVSLPVLARALNPVQGRPPEGIGDLYAINTLGAAAGAFVTTWVLFPLGGVSRAIQCAVALNLLCPALLLVAAPNLFRRRNGTHAEAAPLSAPLEPPNEPAPEVRTFAALFLVSGTMAMAMEMVWFRFFGALAKSSAHTMGTLLSLYIAGLGTGAWIFSARVRHFSQPWKWAVRFQAGAALYASCGAAVLLEILKEVDSANFIKSYLNSYEPISANTALQLLREAWSGSLAEETRPLLWVYPLLNILIPAMLMGPSTLLLGASFPLLQRSLQSNSRKVGWRTGLMQTANIAGCMIGTVGTVALVLPTGGTSAVFRLLALSGAGLLGTTCLPSIRVAIAVWAAGLWFSIQMPNQRQIWATVHGCPEEHIVLAEDASGVSVLKRDPGNRKVWIFVNGIGQSWIPHGGVHTLLGAVPALLHPNPEHIAVIGLGSADTLCALMARSQTQSILCAEIVSTQSETLRQIASEPDFKMLASVLQDPRLSIVHGDGRMLLLQSTPSFDVIEADALRPDSAHAGSLYSEEYFQLAASRLRKGGLLVTWLPTQRVAATMSRVFPYVTILGGILGIGSQEPLLAVKERLRARAADPGLAAYFAAAGISLPELLAPITAPETTLEQLGPSFERSNLRIHSNTDAFPRDEFALPALWGAANP